MSFLERFEEAWQRSDSAVCVGLDPDLNRLPKSILNSNEAVFEFNRQIIDATADLVCAYKPQIAHYAAIRAEHELEKTIDYIKDNYPDVVVILDAKRGDIGSTADMYAREAFERYGAHAVTINAYMGSDAVEPFTKNENVGAFVLCRTSNSGAHDFQERTLEDRKLFLAVAEKVAGEWNEKKNLGLVVGATAPEQMRLIRESVGDAPFLVPGVGAQGGSVADVMKGGRNSKGKGLVINSSRGIIYAGSGEDFAEAARQATQKLRDEINSFA